jgi:hypothetical protein
MSPDIINQLVAAGSGLLGAIIGAASTVGYGAWVRASDKKAEAAYLAVRVINILDPFAEKCAMVVADDGLEYGQRGADGFLSRQVPTPNAPVLPTDVDWKSIDHTTVYRILSLPSKTKAAEEAVNYAWRELASGPDMDEGFDAQIDHFGALGLEAASISAELRQQYGLPPLKYEDWQDPVATIKRIQARLTKSRAQYAALSADLM